MTEEAGLWIIATDARQTRGASVAWQQLPTSQIEDGLRGLYDRLAPLLENIGHQVGTFRAAEIELSLALSATGKVGLLGSGVEAEGCATVTVKFVRSDK